MSPLKNCTSSCPSVRMYCNTDLGLCTCSPLFAQTGPECTETSSATLGNGLIFATTLFVCVYTLLRFINMFGEGFRNWKFNSAHCTFVFAVIALFLQTINNILMMVITLAPATAPDAVIYTIGYLGNVLAILLAIAVLTMSFVFIELSAGIHVIGTRHKYRRILYAIVSALVIIVALEVFLASAEVQTVTGVVIVVIVACAALIGPAVLYVTSARTMIRAADLSAAAPSKFTVLCCAMLQEILFIPGAMNRALGMTVNSNSQSSRASRNSPENKQGLSKGSASAGSWYSPSTSHSGNLPRNASKGSDVMAGANAELNLTQVHFSRQQTRMVAFLGRTIRMGFYLATSLLLFIVSAVASVFVTNGATAIAIIDMFQEIGYTLALFQLLLYLDHAFGMKKPDKSAPSSKPNTKDEIDGSKREIGSKVEFASKVDLRQGTDEQIVALPLGEEEEKTAL